MWRRDSASRWSFAYPSATAARSTVTGNIRASSLRLGPRRLHHLRPLLDLRLDVGAEGFRRRAHDLEAQAVELLHDVRLLEDLHELVVQPRHHRARRARGSQHA